jgi:hypothetical protein
VPVVRSDRLTEQAKTKRKEQPNEGQDEREGGQRDVGQLISQAGKQSLEFKKSRTKKVGDAPKG